jgi:hypothetical protein
MVGGLACPHWEINWTLLLDNEQKPAAGPHVTLYNISGSIKVLQTCDCLKLQMVRR